MSRVPDRVRYADQHYYGSQKQGEVTPPNPSSYQHNELAGRSDADAHPISAITGLQEALSHNLTPLRFDHPGVASTWVIQHNLGRNPTATVLDSSSRVVVADVRHLDENTLAVYLSAPASGSVICL